MTSLIPVLQHSYCLPCSPLSAWRHSGQCHQSLSTLWSNAAIVIWLFPPLLMVFLHHRRRRRRTQGCPWFAWHRRQEATNDQSLSLIASRHVDGLHINPACQHHHDHHIGSLSIVGFSDFPASGVRPLYFNPEKSWSKGPWTASPLENLPFKEIIHQKVNNIPQL